MKSENKKLTKKQLLGLRNYRRKTILILSLISLISLWFKMGLNITWNLNDVIIEILILFFIVIAGILSNIKNDFPIFQFRKFQFNKEFSYSIITSFSLLFIFIIYKNIVDHNFVSYLAELSIHDLLTLIIFTAPIFLLIIYLIYLGFIIKSSKGKKKTKKELIYSDNIERSLNQYRSISIKVIYILISISIWIKIGFNPQFTFYEVSTEIFSIIAIITIWIIGNISNKLPALYNCHFKIDRYFFYSIALPYLLIIIYTLINSRFRFLIGILGIKELISLLVIMSPLFMVSSIIFYIGCKNPNKLNEQKNRLSPKKKKILINTLTSLIITLFLSIGTIVYCFSKMSTFNLENILQSIIVLIPISTVLYIILYNEMKKINK